MSLIQALPPGPLDIVGDIHGEYDALVQLLAKKANVPLQLFYNRSDMAGGSTLGNISTAQVAIKSVDIGLAQLAMHSAYETAGVKDTESLIRAAKVFYR